MKEEEATENDKQNDDIESSNDSILHDEQSESIK